MSMAEAQIAGELRTRFATRVGAPVDFMATEYGAYRLAPGHFLVGRPRVAYTAAEDGRVVQRETESEEEARGPDVLSLGMRRIEARELDSMAALLAGVGIAEVTHATLTAALAAEPLICAVLDEMHAAGELP